MSEARSDKGIWKRALWLVPLVVVTGSLAGAAFGITPWYENLEKPAFQPPGYLFGIVWPALYTMIALALATVLNEPPSEKRTSAITFWVIQLVLNYGWSYLFFGARAIEFAKFHLLAIILFTAITIASFFRIRPLAGWLMLPYLGWLIFAYMLNSTIVALNPGAGEPFLGIG